MKTQTDSRTPFVLTLLYLAFEYGRPQDVFAFIEAIRPQLILTLMLLVSLIANMGRLPDVASKQMTRMVLLLLLMATYVPFAANTGRALATTQGFFQVLVVATSIVLYVDTVERLRTLMKVWICLMAYIAVNGILGGGAAGSSFLLDENDFSHLMVIMLPFGVFLLSYESGKTAFLYLVASLLCATSVVASFSRGGFVGLIIVAFVLLLQSSRKIFLLLSAAIFLAIVANIEVTHTGTENAGATYWEEMLTTFQSDDHDYNKDSRKELWSAAWEMFKDYPLGVGPANYPVRLPDYQSDFFGDKSMWGKEAHSIWFTLLPELGIPGVLLYFTLLFANFRDLRYLRNLQTHDEGLRRLTYFLAAALFTAIAGYLASGSFISVLYYPHYWYLTAMIVATRKIASRSMAREASGKGGETEGRRTAPADAQLGPSERNRMRGPSNAL